MAISSCALALETLAAACPHVRLIKVHFIFGTALSEPAQGKARYSVGVMMWSCVCLYPSGFLLMLGSIDVFFMLCLLEVGIITECFGL